MSRFLVATVIVLVGLAVALAQSRPAGQPGEGLRQSSRERAAGSGNADENKSAAGGGLVRRGEYLVTSVAMCIECHTPRNEQGELIRLQMLEGAQMPVRSPWSSQQWAYRAPSLAGLPGGWSEADVVNLLVTGKDPQGRTPNTPMPAFRMTRDDAVAVAAYLKELPGGSVRPRSSDN